MISELEQKYRYKLIDLETKEIFWEAEFSDEYLGKINEALESVDETCHWFLCDEKLPA